MPMMGGPRVDEASYLAEMIPPHHEEASPPRFSSRAHHVPRCATGQRILVTQSVEIQDQPVAGAQYPGNRDPSTAR